MGICHGQIPEENTPVLTSQTTATPQPRRFRRDHLISSTNCVRDVFNIFEPEVVIGKGSTCYVVRAHIGMHCDLDDYSFIARDKIQAGFPLAVKVIDKSNRSAVRSFKRAAAILPDLSQENIIQLHGIFMDTNRFFIVQQLCRGGDLLKYIKRRRRLAEDVCQRLMRQILSAVAYLHANGVAHRDIKPENIMFVDSNQTRIVLADFGQTVCVNTRSNVTTRAGTPMFFAPELCSNTRGLTAEQLFASDMWTAGVTCYQMLTGEYPFTGDSKEHLVHNILTREVPTVFLKPLSQHARSFTLGLLDKDWASRFDVRSAQTHPWIDESARMKFLRVRDDSATQPEFPAVHEFDDLCVSARRVDPVMFDNARLGDY